MNEFTILVPQTFNDGSAIPADTIAELRTLAVKTFGGLTVGETVSGFWIDDASGIEYRDTLQRFIIASDDADKVDCFAAYVAIACEQISVYVSRSAADVRFIDRSAHRS